MALELASASRNAAVLFFCPSNYVHARDRGARNLICVNYGWVAPGASIGSRHLRHGVLCTCLKQQLRDDRPRILRQVCCSSVVQ